MTGCTEYHTMHAIATEGFDIWSRMETYLQLWSFPDAWKAGHLATLFASKHVAKYKSLGTMFGATARAKLVEAAESAMECLHSAEFEAPLMKKWHWLHWLLHMPDFLQVVAMEITTLREPGAAPFTHQDGHWALGQVADLASKGIIGL
ncbi:hypothetical protein AK812_SmicGene32892 [Symbiodinium microadriaticum]|uniref:Uncharacterized protein n=1 Tax=Symbiodinium microadriaticum TaxID=2951 RepID=A0A1Q9CSX5_SYMMI|nr:hypothetical protein AK812_SmicGene32892 [Symbiodinium microadriaticum]